MARRARRLMASPRGQRLVEQIAERATDYAAELRQSQHMDAEALYKQVTL